MIVLLTVNIELGRMWNQIVMVGCHSTQTVADRYSSVGVVISLQAGLTRNRCSISAKGKKSFSFPAALVATDPVATRVSLSESKPAGS